MKKQFTRLIATCCVPILLLLISTTGAFAQYCDINTTTAEASAEDYLTNVTFAGIDQSSGFSQYSDYTGGTPGTVTPGVSYDFSGTVFNNGLIVWTENITVYIDWDQSETFDPGERYEFGTCNTLNCTLTGSIDVPFSAISGSTRMRVLEKFGTTFAEDACTNYTYGEVEDYSLNVLGGECTPPDIDYEIVNDCANDTYDVTSTLNDLGSSSFGTQYLTRSDGAGISNNVLVPGLVGQTITIASNIPFGVTVHDSIVSGNPLCTLSRNFEDEICPAENDEACTATELFCGDDLSNQVFLGATQSVDDDCGGSGTADVWFKFVADGTQTYYVEETESDVIVDLWLGDDCESIEQIEDCVDFGENFTVTQAGTYYFRIRPYSTAATYGVALTCSPFDCPGVGNYGGSCDDGDPGTVNDIIQDDCSCSGDPQVPNDESCTATLLNCGDDLSDLSFVGSTQSVDDDCFGSGEGDVWFKFIADGTQTYYIEETQSDVVVDLWLGDDCEAIEQIEDCVDIGENFTVTDAGTYYFRLRPYSTATDYGVALTCTPFDCPGVGNFGDSCDDGDSGTINDRITDECECAGFPIEPNDAICDAAILNCGDTLAQSFLGATPSPEGNCADGVTNDLWYTVTVEEGTFYQVDFLGSIDFVSSTYTTAEVLVGEVGAECTDELEQFSPCTDGILSFYLDTAATYYIRAQPYTTLDSVNIALTCYEVPDNGDCTTAETLACGGTYTGGTSAAPQHDADQTFCVAPAPSIFNTGVWYTYEPETDIVMNFDLTGSTFNTELFLYSGACDELVCEDGDDNSGEGNTSMLSDTLFSGNTYYLYVTGSGNGRGSYVLNTTCIDLECSPTISSLTLVDQSGTPIDCADLDDEYYVQVTLEGGLDDGYNVSLNGGASTVIEPNGTGIVGPGTSPDPGNVSVVGVNNVECAALGTIDVPVCPPAYDVPCGAIPLTVDGGASAAYSNEFAGADEGEISPEGTSCTTDWCSGQGTVENSIWFQIDVPNDVERLSISACDEGTTYDTQLAAYTVDDCADYTTFALIGANDDQVGGCTDASFASTLEICVESGSTIYVQLDGYNGQSGDAVLTVESIADATICQCILPTINLESYAVCTEDSSSYSVDITIDDLGSSDYVNFTYTIGGVDSVLNNVTESFTVDGLPLGSTFSASVELSDPACSDFGDLSASVVQASSACDADCEGTLGGDVGPGTPCDSGGVYGSDCNCLPTPPNDECADAIALECSDYVTGYNVGASLNTGCDGDDRATVWYSYTPEASGTITLSTCDAATDFDSDLNVYTGTCDDLTCFTGFEGDGYVDGALACSFQSFAGAGTFEGEVGVTYYIAVTGYFDGFDSGEGHFGLSVDGGCAGASLNGTVDYNSNCGDRDATVDVYEPGTATLVNSYNTTIAADGTFTIEDLETGTYDVIVKVSGFLAKGTQDVVIATGSNSLDVGAIIGGDVATSNSINVADLSAVSIAFGTAPGDGAYNPLADLDCSGGVNIADISALTQSFGLAGDSAPLGN